MRQKMINLCPITYEHASKMGNFSEWVRMKLKEDGYLQHETHLHVCVKGCQKVTQFEASPMCPQHRVRMKLVPSVQLKLV